MSAPESFRIFVSAVSSEFGNARSSLASDLRKRGLQVKVQEDFRQEADADTLLKKLHNYIAQCSAVICIIGKRCGESPPAAAAQPFQNCLPSPVQEASYTQWEFYFARSHGKRPWLYMANDDHMPEQAKQEDANRMVLQTDFVSRIKQEGLDRSYFSTVDELCRKVLVQDWPNFASVPRTRINNLPTVSASLFGRAAQLATLDSAWSNPETKLVQVIAPGGTGKTALVWKWLLQKLDGKTEVFTWSFYTQGSLENRQTSSEPFFNDIFAHYGIMALATDSVYAKAELLAHRFREGRTLLVLDGIEPLQDSVGALQDSQLKALLQELATRNSGLVVCTSRVELIDIPEDSPRTYAVRLENLLPADGAELLGHLLGPGNMNNQEELRLASEEYGNQALALTLLGSYLAEFCDCDIRRRVEIPALLIDEINQGGHARRVMEGYARMFAGLPELELLYGLGFFDRPIELETLKLVLSPMQSATRFRAAVNHLVRARLILLTKPSASSNDKEMVDCHPLVREHFGRVIRSAKPTEFREGHSTLFTYYRDKAKEFPSNRDEMLPLFHAVYHGCQAGRYSETCEVYYQRICQGDRYVLTNELGEFGTDLSLLVNFFEIPWTKPVAQLSVSDQALLLSQAHFALRALGRIGDAVKQIRSLEGQGIRLKIWRQGAVRYSNLSQLLLMLGDVDQAVGTAQLAVDQTQCCDDPVERMTRLTDLADALHYRGEYKQAAALFRAAERIQEQWEPAFPMLYSVPGYRYCDLLLTCGELDEVRRRANIGIKWAEERHLVLDIGLNCISLGRTYPKNEPEAADFLNRGVDAVRRAGSLVHLLSALLARGNQRDLDEVKNVAGRCGFQLRLADYHIAQAHLDIASNELVQAGLQLQKARALVSKTRYARRQPDIDELSRMLAK